jgi:hypothetical protein
MAKVDFQPDLGQGSVIEESPGPLTDPVGRHVAVNCPTAMSAEEQFAHTAMTSVDSIRWTDRALLVQKWTLSLKEQVQVVFSLVLPLMQIVILTLDIWLQCMGQGK